MFKRILTAVALSAGLGMAGAASAGVATFADQPPLICSAPEHDGGLGFAEAPPKPFHGCAYSQPSPEDLVGDPAYDNALFDGEGDASTGGIPEPAVWGFLLLGFGVAGLMLRRARELALAAINEASAEG